MSSGKDRTVYKEMDVEGNILFHKWQFMDKTKHLIYDLDKCVGCSLCYVVCPDHAIEIGPVPDIAQKIIEDMPAVLIDTDKCSFCFMCERVCINDVYKTTDENNEEIDKSDFPKLEKIWIYDEESCKFDADNPVCKICEIIRDPINVSKGRNFSRDLKKVVDECPTKSMKFNSPFSGKVTILKSQLHKCDPNGCKACVNICPTESFFIPQTAEDVVKYGKIACNEDTCIYCGACENSCPDNLIIVTRDDVNYTIPEKAEHKPWMNRWKKQFGNLLLSKYEIEEIQAESDHKINIAEDNGIDMDEEFIKISPSEEFSIDEYKNNREKNKELAKKMDENFEKANVRIFIHKKKIDKLKRFLKKSLK